jgi:PBP1b-binding outer membrane lipoprotein LpoB
MIMKIRVFLKCVVLFSILFLTGCSQIKVEGKVSFSDGTPLSTGKVVFEDTAHTFTANINKDGTFRMGMLKDGEGIPAGKYNVAIAEAVEMKITTDGKPPIIEHLIAEKFRSTKTAGIEFDIKSNKKDISIVVEKP